MTTSPLIDELGAIVGDRGVITDAADLQTYCTDWRHLFHGNALCAVLPRNTQQVAAVVPSLREAVKTLLAEVLEREEASDGVNALVHDIVVAHGGSISAEHGIGQYRVKELERCRPRPELELARRVKHALDPSGLMNPGKVLAASRAAQ